ncbi:hypothetical protein CVT25_005807 [Psilocybe cyanescens]|uniref:tRNA-guanine(15) transglycosylase-like domain-containing protein n=1 Tax=Psilocybe cyanescens TaxID=93625 RepID=A0A409XA37_PSICY|nr:hypothetical protein CVT25_005807 [Psilocybe cyanescens]
MSQPNAAVAATFSFTLSSSSARHGPRIGTLVTRRPDASASGSAGAGAMTEIQIQTPGMLTTTSRGVVPHLSRDHHRGSAAIRWVNIPFETFLEHNPPLPTLQPGPTPLHTLLGFTPSAHLLSLSARDPASAHDMPPNSHTHISVSSLRGVRKLTADAWRDYVARCRPDVVFALSDVPFTDPPYSQKRLTKSIERSAAWLANLLRRPPPPPPSSSSSEGPSTTTDSSSPTPAHLPAIFVHMSGGASPPARKALSALLTEPLFGPEAAAVHPLRTLDEGVAGYAFDLVPLRLEVGASARKASAPSPPESQPQPQSKSPSASDHELQRDPPSQSQSQSTPTPTSLSPLLLSSLALLLPTKPRLINGALSPHEILHYITHVGADLFDAGWAQRAADVGVALDFVFPVREGEGEGGKEGGKERTREIGHNLYAKEYALDFAPFADAFRGASSSSSKGKDKDKEDKEDTRPICPCAACSPIACAPSARLYHGADGPAFSGERESSSESEQNTPEAKAKTPEVRYRAPYTRAYMHHLLHTHEMSAHALLVLHNLAVLDAFFAGVRGVIASSSSAAASSLPPTSTPTPTQAQDDTTPTPTQSTPTAWETEVRKFTATYSAEMRVFEDAERRWAEVDRARGKGRLAREKEKKGKEEGKVKEEVQEEEGVIGRREEEEGNCVLEP